MELAEGRAVDAVFVVQAREGRGGAFAGRPTGCEAAMEGFRGDRRIVRNDGDRADGNAAVEGGGATVVVGPGETDAVEEGLALVAKVDS
jgi:hypothetical protein